MKAVPRIRTFRIGLPRRREEGLRIGAVRHVPQRVAKNDYARHDYFDVWFPTLSPSAELLDWAPAANSEIHTRRDSITDAGLLHFQRAYPAKGEGESLSKEDLFYYIYGLLHSPDYRSRYADDLGKELPRIPAVKTFADFRAFFHAGRELAHWHLNYETGACHEGVVVVCGKEEGTYCPSSAAVATAEEATVRSPLLTFRVTKRKLGKTKDASGKCVNDKSTVIYNEFIALRGIPLQAYDYIVNGKPALEWVMGTNPSPPTKTAASPTTPTSGPPKRWATPSIRWSYSCGW